MDFILQKDTNKLFFLEVNTMPGQSENSLIPQQVRAAGMDLGAFYNAWLQDALDNANPGKHWAANKAFVGGAIYRAGEESCYYVGARAGCATDGHASADGCSAGAI